MWTKLFTGLGTTGGGSVCVLLLVAFGRVQEVVCVCAAVLVVAIVTASCKPLHSAFNKNGMLNPTLSNSTTKVQKNLSNWFSDAAATATIGSPSNNMILGGRQEP